MAECKKFEGIVNYCLWESHPPLSWTIPHTKGILILNGPFWKWTGPRSHTMCLKIVIYMTFHNLWICKQLFVKQRRPYHASKNINSSSWDFTSLSSWRGPPGSLHSGARRPSTWNPRCNILELFRWTFCHLLCRSQLLSSFDFLFIV